METQSLNIYPVKGNAFDIQYSPFRNLNIRYTDSTTNRTDLQENNIMQKTIECFVIQESEEQLKSGKQKLKTHRNQTQSSISQVKILSIDLMQAKRQQCLKSKENVLPYKLRLKKELAEIEDEILKLQV